MGSWTARGTAISLEENRMEVGSNAWLLKNNLLQMLLCLQTCVDHSPQLAWLCFLLSENAGALQWVWHLPDVAVGLSCARDGREE